MEKEIIKDFLADIANAYDFLIADLGDNRQVESDALEIKNICEYYAEKMWEIFDEKDEPVVYCRSIWMPITKTSPRKGTLCLVKCKNKYLSVCTKISHSTDKDILFKDGYGRLINEPVAWAQLPTNKEF